VASADTSFSLGSPGHRVQRLIVLIHITKRDEAVLLTVGLDPHDQEGEVVALAATSPS